MHRWDVSPFLQSILKIVHVFITFDKQILKLFYGSFTEAVVAWIAWTTEFLNYIPFLTKGGHFFTTILRSLVT